MNDSKAVYSPSAGLRELERSVLTMAACAWPEWGGGEAELLARIAPGIEQRMSGYAWYRTEPSARFPHECEALALKLMANALRQEMKQVKVARAADAGTDGSGTCAGGVSIAHMTAQVVLEGELNQLMDRTRNKASALFSIASIHIDHLVRTYGSAAGGLVLMCDRQGGREHYGGMLRSMFDDWSMEITIEMPKRSEYRLTNGRGGFARIIFCEKAESQCMAVALASMLSKYLRESLMRRFNAYWAGEVPGVAPTAGYYTDGVRFLRDIQLRRSELGIADAGLVRSR